MHLCFEQQKIKIQRRKKDVELQGLCTRPYGTPVLGDEKTEKSSRAAQEERPQVQLHAILRSRKIKKLRLRKD